MAHPGGAGEAGGSFAQLRDVFILETSQPLQIEILPSALHGTGHDVLKDGNFVGVPKPVLIEAFLQARATVIDTNSTMTDDVLLHVSTAIMLLYSPEHVTAANLRKRRLCQIDSQNDDHQDTIKRLELPLHRERWLLESLLTSPLNKHTKSPTLWNHQYWLDSKFAIPSQLRGQLLDLQWRTVSKAAEIHPKNYYAWGYMRRTVVRMTASLSMSARSDYMRPLMEYVQAWCVNHPSDVSGWSFLLFVMRICESLESSERIVNEALSTMIRLKMSGEACWGFIKEVLVSGRYVHEKSRYAFLQELKRQTSHKANDIGRSGQRGTQHLEASALWEVAILRTVRWIESGPAVHSKGLIG